MDFRTRWLCRSPVGGETNVCVHLRRADKLCCRPHDGQCHNIYQLWFCFTFLILTNSYCRNFWPRFCSNCRVATGQKRHYRPLAARYGCHPGEHGAGVKRKGSVAATCRITGACVFFHRIRWPVGHPFSALSATDKREVSPVPGDDIRHPLWAIQGCRFVIIGLTDKTGTGVDISPHVALVLIP